MDIYQILVTHNRGWTFRETICFAIIFLLAVIMFSLLLYWHKICLSQMIAGLLLLIFLAVVFVSTVFTRDPGERQHQLELFWSWKEILGIPPTGRLGATGTKNWIIGRKYIEYDIAFSSRSAITIRDETESAVVSGSTGGYRHFSRNRSITVTALQRAV